MPAAGSSSRFSVILKPGFSAPRTVIGEIKAFLDDDIDIGRAAFAGAFARMQQHVLDDRVGALAVLHDFFEIALQAYGSVRRFPHASCRRARSASALR